MIDRPHPVTGPGTPLTRRSAWREAERLVPCPGRSRPQRSAGVFASRCVSLTATAPLPRSSASPAWPTRSSTWPSNWAWPAAAGLPLVRLHSECLTGDVFGSQRCDCGPQLREAVERITEHGGYVLYLRQEGRGIGLYDKLDAYALQDRGLDTYDANLALGHRADERDYTSAAQMLRALGANRIGLLSNNPDKSAELARLGITVARQVPTALHLTGANAAYLATKARRGGHDLLSRGPERAAGPHRHAGPLAGPAHFGIEGR